MKNKKLILTVWDLMRELTKFDPLAEVSNKCGEYIEIGEESDDPDAAGPDIIIEGHP